MAFFCKIKLNPSPNYRPWLEKRAAVPAHFSGLGHGSATILLLCLSRRSRAYEIRQPVTKSASAEITTEMCSGGLALPSKLLVEYTFERCWPKPFCCYWNNWFQNITAGAEWQIYKQQVGTCEQFVLLCHLISIMCESLKMKKMKEKTHSAKSRENPIDFVGYSKG